MDNNQNFLNANNYNVKTTIPKDDLKDLKGLEHSLVRSLCIGESQKRTLTEDGWEVEVHVENGHLIEMLLIIDSNTEIENFTIDGEPHTFKDDGFDILYDKYA